ILSIFMSKAKFKKVSEFTEKVYSVVKKIPKGKVLTYKEVAERAGNPLAVRAVGNILNKNYDPEIPCHRVIRSDGKTGGYNRGVISKIDLLRKEGYLVDVK
ncbi:MAG TPA: MGMT family protein, partial [Candidatus Paceibacterota bacterium]|nr:MGMT family protein [Candidatus Paceibacterota bacterium]